MSATTLDQRCSSPPCRGATSRAGPWPKALSRSLINPSDVSHDHGRAPTISTADTGTGEAEERPLPIGSQAVATPVDDPDDPTLRERWPDNEVRIVGRLLPRVSDAPALNGVHRTWMDLSLVEHVGDAFGTMGNLPVFVMPGAPGFTPIYNEIRRARLQKRRLQPIDVWRGYPQTVQARARARRVRTATG